MANQSNTASKVPVILSWVSLGLSLVLLAIPYLFTSNSDWVTPLIGWILTPVVTFGCFGWDFYSQNRSDLGPNFRARDDYGKILAIISYISVVVAIFHIMRFAFIWSLV